MERTTHDDFYAPNYNCTCGYFKDKKFTGEKKQHVMGCKSVVHDNTPSPAGFLAALRSGRGY